MRLPVIFLTTATVYALAAACGGGSNSPQLLHLHGFDSTSDNYRTYIRATFIDNPVSASVLCNSIKGLSARDAANAMEARTAPSPSAVPANFTPVPGQTDNPDDGTTAAQIVIDECNRISP